jgi:hypothetical protein
MRNTPINIESATQTGSYRLRIIFDDKTVQDLDFQPFLTHSLHPDILAYLEQERFSSFKVQYGELVWGDYDLCFPVIDLYKNTIEHREMSKAGYL